jgi:hypothetical protein
MTVQSRIAAGIAAAAALGVLLTACSAAPSSSPSSTSSSGQGSASTTVAANAATGAQVSANRTLQFPNKDLTVLLDGYNSAVGMVEFHRAVWVAGGPDDGHYAPDPTNSAAYRLAIAPDATLTALSQTCTGPSKGNPNLDGWACTTTQFVAALTDRSAIGPAKLHVNASDQIQSAQELYHP